MEERRKKEKRNEQNENHLHYNNQIYEKTYFNKSQPVHDMLIRHSQKLFHKIILFIFIKQYSTRRNETISITITITTRTTKHS